MTMCMIMVSFNVFLLVYWVVEDVCPRSFLRRTLSNTLCNNGYCHPVLTPAPNLNPYSTTARSVMSIFRGEQHCMMPVRRCSLFHLIYIQGSQISWDEAVRLRCAARGLAQRHELYERLIIPAPMTDGGICSFLSNFGINTVSDVLKVISDSSKVQKKNRQSYLTLSAEIQTEGVFWYGSLPSGL